MTDCNVENSLKYHLEQCFTLLHQYSWLLDSYILDFFTEDHWDKLPGSWKELLKEIAVEDFHTILNIYQKNQTSICPLSIICIRVLVQHLMLPRQMPGSDSTSHPKLWNLFLKHVKPKKCYEIFKVAETVAEIAKRLNISYIVDIGSGLGHLSRVLAYGYDLNVCSIETQIKLTTQARKLDCEFETMAAKYLPVSELNKLKSRAPVHMNKTIKPNLDVLQFTQDIKTAFSTHDNNFKFGVIGLHPCGDLAAVLLKFYSSCEQSKFINLIGCCYHKLTTSLDAEYNFGFPLTSFCYGRYMDISYEARALACHAIEAYCERLRSRNYEHLKVHCYRATLEKIIDKNWPELRKSALGNVKAGPELNFNLYCQMALKKLDLTVPTEDLYSVETLKNLSRWEDVVKFYSLRLILAPLIETIILLDRKMYLLEKGISARIVAAFDPTISPRNLLLVSEKVP
ncbi:hypothetical protein RUM43_005045 [Polyplax serrata]|uniref:Methyltransferase domain-containing protein n=1 Tax=Polyplax serrata TaxID=468196 RepID=A0AAN8SEW5_POLSC